MEQQGGSSASLACLPHALCQEKAQPQQEAGQVLAGWWLCGDVRDQKALQPTQGCVRTWGAASITLFLLFKFLKNIIYSFYKTTGSPLLSPLPIIPPQKSPFYVFLFVFRPRFCMRRKHVIFVSLSLAYFD
jgi:hypothetical protein